MYEIIDDAFETLESHKLTKPTPLFQNCLVLLSYCKRTFNGKKIQPKSHRYVS